MEMWFVYGRNHRINGPSKIDYYSNGNICRELWVEFGHFRTNNFCVIEYRENGSIKSKGYHNCRDKYNNKCDHHECEDKYSVNVTTYNTSGKIKGITSEVDY